MINNDSGFYSPPRRLNRKIERHINLLHCLGGALLGVFLAVMLLLSLPGCATDYGDYGDFTDSGVGCLLDCAAPAPEPPECADCEVARLGDNLYLTIREGE